MTSLPAALLAHLPTNRHRRFLSQCEEAGSEIGAYVATFVREARGYEPLGFSKELGHLSAETGEFVQSAWEGLTRDVQGIPALQGTQPLEELLRGEAQLKLLCARVAQVLLAMRLSGIDEETVVYTQGVMTRYLEETGLALIIAREASRLGVAREDVAVAAYGAVDSTRVPNIYPTVGDSIRQRGLKASGRLGKSDLVQLGEIIADEVRRVDALVTDLIAVLSTRGRERLGITEIVNTDLPIRVGHASVIGTTKRVPDGKIDLKLLVGFLAVARGGMAGDRLAGALTIIRDVTALAQTVHGVKRPVWDVLVVDHTLDSLETLTRVAREERGVNRVIEGKWRLMEDKVERGPKTRSGERLPMPLMKLEALDARGMYYHNAIALGLPLSVALAEIHDSDEMTFGPSERDWFTRIVTYRARGYAANMASQENGVFGALESGEATGEPMSVDRIDAIRLIVRRVETSLRDLGRLSDSEIMETAKNRLEHATREGLSRGELVALLAWPNRGHAPGLVEDMLLRLRAEQEVRVITAALSSEEGLGREIIGQLRSMPHARTFAERTDPMGQWFWGQRARNGETLAELERDTRGRWNRYRQEATAGRDVRTVVLPAIQGGPGEYNPLEKPFGKPQDRGDKPPVRRTN